MNASTATPLSIEKPDARAILWGGLACGVCDITAALVVYGYFGIKPLRLLQSVASGVLGPSSYSGGIATAMLGLLCHFVVAFGAATTYFLLSRAMPFLLRYTAVSGPLYGIAVYFFMQYVTVPLSAARRSPFSLKFMIIGVLIHIFCVGLPIAIAARRSATR